MKQLLKPWLIKTDTWIKLYLKFLQHHIIFNPTTVMKTLFNSQKFFDLTIFLFQLCYETFWSNSADTSFLSGNIMKQISKAGKKVFLLGAWKWNSKNILSKGNLIKKSANSIKKLHQFMIN